MKLIKNNINEINEKCEENFYEENSIEHKTQLYNLHAKHVSNHRLLQQNQLSSKMFSFQYQFQMLVHHQLVLCDTIHRVLFDLGVYDLSRSDFSNTIACHFLEQTIVCAMFLICHRVFRDDQSE